MLVISATTNGAARRRFVTRFVGAAHQLCGFAVADDAADAEGPETGGGDAGAFSGIDAPGRADAACLAQEC